MSERNRNAPKLQGVHGKKKAGFYVQKGSSWTKNKHAELKRQQC